MAIRRKGRGKNRLSLQEEGAMLEMGAERIGNELRKELENLENLTALQALGIDPKTWNKLNSLIHAYASFEISRIRNNFRILMAWDGRISFAKMGAISGMDASAISLMFSSGKESEITGSWNLRNLLRMSATLNVGIKSVLFADLHRLIGEEIRK